MQTFRVKLQPNKLQRKKIDSYVLESIDIYNTTLEILLAQDELVSNFDVMMIYQISDIPSWISQHMCKRAYKAVERYKFPSKDGKKFGIPRFKTEKTKGNSFAYSAHKTHNPIKQFGNEVTVHIPGIGKVKGKGDTRQIVGTVKQVAIKRDSCGTYWSSITTDNVRKIELPEPITEVIGIDFGLKHTVNASNIDGSVVIQPERKKFLDKKNLESLKSASNNDRKALPFVHRKIARRRNDYNWKLSRKIVSSATNIFGGDVSPRWLFSGRLARYAADIALFELKLKISYMAESAGRYFEVIPEAYTSRTCSKCEQVNEKLKLSDRVFECSCGFKLDRDLNSARNMAKRGLQLSLRSSTLEGVSIKKLPDQALYFSTR